ncbi:MAG: hypothetical protein AB7E34_03865 [Acidaminococcaceae bacterium]
MYLTKKEQSDGLLLKLNFLFTIFYLMWSLVPYLSRNISNGVVLALIVLWLVSALLSKNIINIKIPLLGILVIFWSLILTIYFLIGNENFAVGNLYLNILFFFPIFMFLFYSDEGKRKYIKWLLAISIILVTITAISNIIILIDNPYASKALTGSLGDTFSRYKNTNLATVSIVMPIVLLVPIMFSLSKKLISKELRALMIISIIVNLIFIVKAGSSISLLILIIGFIFSRIMWRKNSSFNPLFVIISIISILIGVFFIEKIGVILIELSYFVENAMYSSRLQEIANIFLGIDSNGSLIARIEDTMHSVITFLYNPIFGKGLIYSLDIEDTGIGMHSQIIDDLARFGFLGLMFNIGIYYLYVKKLFSNLVAAEAKRTIKTSILLAILLSLFNITTSTSFGVVLFFILPIYAMVYGRKKTKEKLQK